MRRRFPLAAALSLAMLATGAGARADDASTIEARSYFNRGVESFRDGAYDAALVQFKRAYAIVPNYRVLYNIGQTSLRLQDYAASLDAFTRYLAEGGAELPADRRAAVETEIAQLERRVSRVAVVTNAVDGEVLVDDASVGRLPLARPLLVSAGRRKITVVPKGAPPVSRVIDVAGGEPMRIELSTTAPEPRPAPPVSPAPAPAPASASASEPPEAPPSAEAGAPHTGAWIALGASAALLAGAGAFGVVALGAKSDAEAELGRYPGSRADLDDARSRMKTTALVADVLGGAAIAAAGAGVYLFVSGGAP
jgi:hypothetical protein